MVFLRYELINYYGVATEPREVICNIVDTDFQETVSTVIDGGVDIVNPLIDVYERRGENVAANLAALVQHISTRFNIEVRTFILNSCENEKFAKYREEVEKYLVLM